MYAFQISGDRPSHTVMLSVLAYESHSLGDGDPCKVCLKILPVSFDFVCILLRIHVLLTGLPFHFLKYDIFSPSGLCQWSRSFWQKLPSFIVCTFFLIFQDGLYLSPFYYGIINFSHLLKKLHCGNRFSHTFKNYSPK